MDGQAREDGPTAGSRSAEDLKSRLSAEISRLSGSRLNELRAAWAAEFRREPAKELWRDLLLRTLVWRLHSPGFLWAEEGW